MKKNIVITGVTGFIGRNLFRYLKKINRYNPIGISSSKNYLDETPIIRTDYKDYNRLYSEIERYNPFCIVHLAAKVPGSFEESEECWHVNEKLDNLMLKLGAKLRIEKFIYASGTSIYGTKEVEKIAENSPIKIDNYYTLSKRIGELLCEQFSRSHLLKTTILRISAPYGKDCQRSILINVFYDRTKSGLPLIVYGKGERKQNFTHIDDILSAILCAIESDFSGIYNIASLSSISMKDLAKKFLEIFPASKSSIQYDSKKYGNDEYRIEVDITKAQKELNYYPKVSLEDGIRTISL